MDTQTATAALILGPHAAALVVHRDGVRHCYNVAYDENTNPQPCADRLLDRGEHCRRDGDWVPTSVGWVARICAAY